MLAHEPLQNFLGEILNYLPCAEGRERLKKKVNHSWLVGGRFNQQLHMHAQWVQLFVTLWTVAC